MLHILLKKHILIGLKSLVIKNSLYKKTKNKVTAFYVSQGVFGTNGIEFSYNLL